MVNNPRVHPINWPDPKSGPWLIKIHTATVAGRMECVGVEVLAYNHDPYNRRPFLPDLPGDKDPTPIHAAPFRDIPLGRLVQQALDTQIKWGDQLRAAAEHAGLSDEYLDHLQEQTDAAGRGRGGRRGHGPEHYKQVADVYSAAWRGGANPTQAVAEWMEWRHADAGPVAKSTAAKWVSRARSLGFLEQTDKGRSGGVKEENEQ